MPNQELILGDCLDVLPKISDKSVDIVLTDPPYGTTACKWDSVIPFEQMWKELKRIIKDNGCIALFGNEPFSSYLRTSNIKWFKYDWIYRKPQGINPLLAKKQPLNDIEIITIFYKKQTNYNPQFTIDKPYKVFRDKNKRNIETLNFETKPTQTINNGFRYPKKVLDFKTERGLHPTQKPVALLEYLIKTYTNENDTVLDFTMGSGSTGVACKNLNRKFIGIEKDKKYFGIAKNRINGVLV